MTSNKYLRTRGNVWWADFTIPAISESKPAQRFRFSLNTADDEQARGFRDRFILPLIREASAHDALNVLAQAIQRTGGRAAVLMDDALVAAGLPPVSRADKAAEGITVRELADMRIAYLEKQSDLAPSSINKHRATLNALCTLVGGDIPAAQFEREHVTRFRDGLAEMPVGWQKMGEESLLQARADTNRRRISLKSIQRELQNVRAFWQWAIDEGKVPFKEVPGSGVRVRLGGVKDNGGKECPSVEQAEALLALPCPDGFNDEAWRMLPVFGRYTLCRIGELAMLAAEDVVTEKGVRCLRIHGSHLKTASSERLVPVADKLAPVLDELLAAHPAGRLFPECGDWTDSKGQLKAAHYFLKAWNRYAKRVGNFSFHCWRTYGNVQMMDAKIDAVDRDRIQGHKASGMQAHYISEDLHRYKAAVDTIA